MGLFSEMMDEASEQSARIAELEVENLRLATGLKTIIRSGLGHGAAWCVAQARGYLEDLDFDAYPETGRPDGDVAEA
jgi:hypothetical protein